MKKYNANIGAELLFLLRQQRYLYHQLKLLTYRQHQLAGKNSSEEILEIIFGRRKLVEKILELGRKLSPIKSAWRKLSRRIEPKQKAEAHKIAVQVQEIVGEILAMAPPEITQNLPLLQDKETDKLFAEI